MRNLAIASIGVGWFVVVTNFVEVCNGDVSTVKVRAEGGNDAFLFEVEIVSSDLRVTLVAEVALVNLLEMGFGTDKAVVGCFELLDPSLQALGGSSLCLLIAVLIGVEESLQAVDASLEGSIGACMCPLCSVKAGLVSLCERGCRG